MTEKSCNEIKNVHVRSSVHSSKDIYKVLRLKSIQTLNISTNYLRKTSKDGLWYFQIRAQRASFRPWTGAINKRLENMSWDMVILKALFTNLSLNLMSFELWKFFETMCASSSRSVKIIKYIQKLKSIDFSNNMASFWWPHIETFDRT